MLREKYFIVLICTQYKNWNNLLIRCNGSDNCVVTNTRYEYYILLGAYA